MSTTLSLLIAALALLQAPAPPPTPESLKAKALDPAILKKEAARATGCLAHESGSASEQFQTKARLLDGSTRGTISGLAVDTNPIPEVDRMPRYYAPGERASAQGFKVHRLDGSSLSVDQLRGLPVVVFIFKPDCKYSAEMLNEIIRLQAVEDRARVKVLAVSISDGAWTDIARYRQQNINALPATFPIFRPSSDQGAGVSIFKDLFVTPTTYILDREGRVAWRITGGVRGSIQDKINHIRTEPAPSSTPIPALQIKP